MPGIAYIILSRNRRRNNRRGSFDFHLRQIGLGCIAILSLGISLLLIGLTLVYANLTADLPSPEYLSTLLEPPDGLLLQPTSIYDRSGEHVLLKLEHPATSKRRYLPLDENQPDHLPISLVNATLAMADPTFWNNPGYSIQGVRDDSHSTLAQRLVFDLLLNDEPASLGRAIRERILAGQVIHLYGHRKVLEWYLNSSNYGNMAYGVDAAAWLYLGKSAASINLAESAMLAAISQTPALNPFDAPQVAQERSQQVLEVMLNLGYITPQEFTSAVREKISFARNIEFETKIAPAFTKLVLEQLAEHISMERLVRGGIVIRTTLDYDLQLQSLCTLETQMAHLGDMPTEGITARDGTVCQAARLLPALSPPDDKINIANISTNLVILDPASGQLLAMIGEVDPGSDPAHLPGHPPGSILTPLVYLAAFSRGYTPASLVWDVPSSLPEGIDKNPNPDDAYHGPVRIRTALANDYLVPAVQLLEQMGLSYFGRIANQVGLSSLSIPSGEDGYRLLLDEGEITLLDVSRSFGIFANKGILAGQTTGPNPKRSDTTPIQTVTVLEVKDIQGNAVLNCEANLIDCNLSTRPVFSTQLAYLITHILSDETARWKTLGHPNPLEVGFPASAKIGRSSNSQDVWVVGYTPQLVVGIWMGNVSASSPIPVPAVPTAGIWHAIMQYASQDRPSQTWEVPPNIFTVEVCDPSGMLPTTDCPVVVREIFPQGSEPSHQDTLFRSFLINRETGYLATVFTPPELIEERVYVIVPPPAREWAQEAGFPTVPQGYDLIFLAPSTLSNSRINTPAMFSYVRGKVAITGQVSSDNLAYYRVQYGQGLYPRTWMQIEKDKSTPVADGLLASWDTSSLDGLYALQLIVVRKDQGVETYPIQVTVDNEPPDVSIIYPQDGELFFYPQDSVITFQASATDNLELSAVYFIVDTETISVLAAPPYRIPWKVKLGTHDLLVRAIDRAGNVSEISLVFKVER